MKPIFVTRSSMPDFEEYAEEIRGLWDSRVLTNCGEEYKKLESGLRTYLGVPGVSMFCNGHMALEVAFEALGLCDGEVITTPFTFASTTHAIVRKGMTPVFCDVKAGDFTMNPDLIESRITERTRAIVPVHVYGRICDDEAIRRIAKKHGLYVIYDAAHAFGARIGDTGVANLGDVSMFSFHATKVFHTVEGGALCYRDPSLGEKIAAWRGFGLVGKEMAEYVGGNSKMTEFSAAMGVCNLRHIDEEIAKRKKVAERYRERLSGVPGIFVPEEQPGVKSNYAYFPVLFDGYPLSRDGVMDKLAAENIFARRYFYPLTSLMHCYRGKPYYGADTTPVAKYASEHVLTLPFYADLSLSDTDRICDIILANK